MESEDGADNVNPFEEGLQLLDHPHVETEEMDEDDGGEGVGDEEDGDEEDEGEEGDEEPAMTIEGVINPLDFVVGNTSDKQLYEKLADCEYGALAEDNWNQGQRPVKKPRREVNVGATLEEVAEVMNLGDRRRRRKLKKRGRRKGSRNNLSPEITKKLGNANLDYAHGRYEDAISLLNEVVRLAPNLPDPYHTLGLVHNSKGDKKKATDCYMIAAFLSRRDTSLWKRLVTWSLELGNDGQAWYCLSKAITADPDDVTLKYERAKLFLKIPEELKAADTYDQIFQICPDDVFALKKATQLYKKNGEIERSISILEDYLKDHPTGADLTVVDMLASSYMERHEYTKALQHIRHAESVCRSGEFPLYLTIRKGICHAHLSDMEKAEMCFSLLEERFAQHHAELIIAVGNSFVELQQHESALKYYLMLEDCASNNALVSLKIANCYLALKEAASAIQFFYKALGAHEDIGTRLTLASLLFEENRNDEAIKLLSPPTNPGVPEEGDADKAKYWWLDVNVKLKLSEFYRKKGMLDAFVGVIYPLVYDLLIDPNLSMSQKDKRPKEVPISELKRRAEILQDSQADSIFHSFRRLASKNDLLKANRAKKKLLEKSASASKEKTSAIMEAGDECGSEDLEDETPELQKASQWPDFVKDEEHYNLISNLCEALTSLRRYSEALELISLSLKMKALPTEKKDKFWSLGAQIAMNITDPSDGFDYVRYLVQQHPQSKAAWNCYYKLILRLKNRLSKHSKFLHQMRTSCPDLVPPMIVNGNQFTSHSQHQVAAKEYLEAYKQMPESPLINLCAGTALINLALGLRLQNKHQCVAQGMAFLYNNLRICQNSQEALYNLARACHHVGLVSLAASYYEKVLAIRQEDLPLPEAVKMDTDQPPKPGYCDLRREAAYNLHLIYKKSGAPDLARQVLRNYCTL